MSGHMPHFFLNHLHACMLITLSLQSPSPIITKAIAAQDGRTGRRSTNEAGRTQE